MSLRVVVVSRNPQMRLAAATAFDKAPSDWTVELHDTVPEDADVVVFGPDIEADAGVRFDPTQPDRLLEDVIAAWQQRGSAVVVTSAGGGTGTTSLSLHLALARASTIPTCWLDLNAGSHSGDRLGLRGSSLKSWGDIDASETAMRMAALPVAGGFRVLLAPPRESSVDVSAVVERACCEFQRVVIDVAAGSLLEIVLARAGAAVVVMSPTLGCARKTKALLDEFPGAPWVVVTNRIGPGGESTKTALQRIIGRRITMELPCAPALRDCEDEGRLLKSAWSPWRRAVTRLAKALEQA